MTVGKYIKENILASIVFHAKAFGQKHNLLMENVLIAEEMLSMQKKKHTFSAFQNMQINY